MGTQWWVGNRRRPVRGYSNKGVGDPSSLRRQWDEYETAKSLLSGHFLLRCCGSTTSTIQPCGLGYTIRALLRLGSDINRRQIPEIYRFKRILRPPCCLCLCLSLQDILCVVQNQVHQSTDTTATTAARPAKLSTHAILHASDSCNSQTSPPCQSNSSILYILYYLDTYITFKPPSIPSHVSPGLPTYPPLLVGMDGRRSGTTHCFVRLGDETRN